MKNIEKIMTIYLDEENRAAQKYLECQNLYEKQLRLLNELRQYETDYKKRFFDTASDGVRIEKIKNFNYFIAKLQVLIDKQTEHVNHEKNNLDIANQVWQKKRLQRRTLGKLDEKMAQKQRKIYARKEQMQVDEIALRQHYRNDTYD